MPVKASRCWPSDAGRREARCPGGERQMLAIAQAWWRCSRTVAYGVYEQNGIGREFSLEGMLDGFTQWKNVTVNLDAPLAR
jgi:betaine-aldehyde dehydrogenase